MQTYYLFLINPTFKSLYTNNEQILYNVLETIYKTRDEINLCLDIYKQLVNLVDKKSVNLHLTYANYENVDYQLNDGIHHLKNTSENSAIIVYHSHIRLITTRENSFFLEQLKTKWDNIFVCNFENQKYFFINKLKTLSKEDKFSTIQIGG